MSQNPLISIKNLSISVKKNDIDQQFLIENLNLDLFAGEILGLVGESGSGKSLTSLALLQLLPEKLLINEGEILFGESQINLLTLPEEDLRKIRGAEISMIFQEPMTSLNPVMKCGKQVDEMLQIHSNLSSLEIKSRTLELFEQVQIPDPERAYNSYPFELSGGQLQRVMISMAMACKPKLIIADECTTALDVTVQAEIIELLKKLNYELGISILFISHDLDVISEIASRVAVMKKGKIVEIGKTDEIFNNPAHNYTKQLISSKPPLEYKLSKLPKPEFFGQTQDIDDFQKFSQNFILENTLTKDEINGRILRLEQNENIIEVKDLTKIYTTKKNFWGKPISFLKAVDKVSFNIKRGETLGLVGESGCGKSTLSKGLLRLIPMDSGDVLYKGDSLFDLSKEELRRKRKEIQYIFQDPYSSLNPKHRIGYSIQEPMTVHHILNTSKERKDRTIELLELVGLEADHYDRYPHEFSGGQRQRICIARALGLEPQFIVCDEIVSALDVSVQAQVLNLLVELREKFDLSLLFVSHDMSIVKFISDRIMVMYKGRIEETGPSEDIYASPKSEYTQRLLNAIPGRQK